MEEPQKGSSNVTFCFSDDPKNYHDISSNDEMRKDIRSCHSSPCFASFDEPLPLFGSTPLGGNRSVKRHRRRRSSPGTEENRTKLCAGSIIRRELRYDY